MTKQEQTNLARLAAADRRAWDRVEKAKETASERRAELLTAARELHASGVSFAQIATVLGISKTRAAQILGGETSAQRDARRRLSARRG